MKKFRFEDPRRRFNGNYGPQGNHHDEEEFFEPRLTMNPQSSQGHDPRLTKRQAEPRLNDAYYQNAYGPEDRRQEPLMTQRQNHEPMYHHHPYTKQMMPPQAYEEPSDMGFWYHKNEEYMNDIGDPEQWSHRPSPMRMIFAVVGLALIAAVSWFAYRWATSQSHEQLLIQAEPGPFKVRPDDPGGMVIPHQDKLVYDRLEPNNTSFDNQQPVERLLPPPEPPIAEPIQQASPGIPVQQPIPPVQPMQSQPLQSGFIQNAPIQNGSQPSSVSAHVPPDVMEVNSNSQGQQNHNVQNPQGTSATAINQQEQLNQLIMDADDSHEKSRTAPQKPIKEDSTKQAHPKTVLQGYFIQLATLPSEGQAHKEWIRLKKRYPTELRDMAVHVRPYQMPSGEQYRILIGPFKSKLRAIAKRRRLNIGYRVIQLP